MSGLVRQRIEAYLSCLDTDDPDGLEDMSVPKKKGQSGGPMKSVKTSYASAPYAKKKTPKWFRTAYHITGYGNGNWNATKPDHAVKAKTGAQLWVNLHNKQASSVSLRQDGFEIAHMSYIEICGVADAIDKLYVGPSYRGLLFSDPVSGNAVVDTLFEKVYGVKSVALPTMYGNKPGSASLRCIACYYCGLYLPIDLIEIDHWYEQTHGQMGAVIKVLRATNSDLTQDPASGKRAQLYLQTGAIKAVPTRNKGPILAKGRVNLLRRNYEDGTKQSLSDVGLLFFSVAYGAFYNMKHGAEFFRHFVHSIVNLTPVCGTCNKLKNNRPYTLR